MPTTPTQRNVITRPVESRQLDPDRRLTLRQVRDQFKLKGRGGHPINLETLRRWASPKRGFRPAGPSGPAIVLPTVLAHGEHLTMPEWVQWFLDESDRLRDAARSVESPVVSGGVERQAEAAVDRMRARGLEV
jgi:hypothetical protein